MNNLDKQYTDLLKSILDYGVEKKDRTGTGTKSIFGYTIRHKMSEGFPLLTTKKMAWKTIVTELLWFLRGDTNIKYLVDNGCHIWDGDAYKFFKNSFPIKKSNPPKDYINEDGKLLTQEEFINKIKTDDEFAKRWGELGPIYGKQWRKWTKKKMYLSTDGSYENIYDEADQTVIDQISILINDLKTNPDSRRLMVNAWNVGELDQMVLPPCHYGFQVYTRELSVKERLFFVNKSDDEYNKALSNKEQYESINLDFELALTSRMNELNVPTRAISLMWNQRSVDTGLGLPFNIASYGLLLMMLADEVNMVPDELIGNLGDTHIYLNHIEQAKEQIGRDLTDEERYNKWFDNNYETGMERFFDPKNLPDFDNEHYEPTPKRTREPMELPTVHVRDGIFCSSVNDVILENYNSHPSIKAPLSN
jgi:thymidylate synthase